MLNSGGRIRVAGGVILRIHEGELEVLLVYRREFNDWSLPKGKVKRMEVEPEAALREVREETGLQCELLVELGEMHYRDIKDRAKTVRYWAMSPQSGRFEPTSEVDDCRWMGLAAAAESATRSGERDFLARVREMLETSSADWRHVIEQRRYITVNETIE